MRKRNRNRGKTFAAEENCHDGVYINVSVLYHSEAHVSTLSIVYSGVSDDVELLPFHEAEKSKGIIFVNIIVPLVLILHCLL